MHFTSKKIVNIKTKITGMHHTKVVKAIDEINWQR